MKYFISAFMPFMAFFYIKKPIYGYISLLFYLLAIASWSVYPSALLICLTYVILLMWSFFEINDYHSKLIAKKMIDFLKKTNPSIDYDGRDEDDDDDDEDEDGNPRNILESMTRPKYDRYFDKSIVLNKDARNWQNGGGSKLGWLRGTPSNQGYQEEYDSNDAPAPIQMQRYGQSQSRPKSSRKRPAYKGLSSKRTPYQGQNDEQSSGRYGSSRIGGSRQMARR